MRHLLPKRFRGQTDTDTTPVAANPQKELERRHATDAHPPANVPSTVSQTLDSHGEALDTETRATMESRFGHNFSNVRVHTDGAAAESAREIRADAYTVGDDVVFGAGKYIPGTPQGQFLIAHELAHVVQQTGTTAAVQPLALEPDDSRAEREATAMASAAVTGLPLPAVSASASPGTVRRSAAGAIGGGLVGAGIGAALGSLLGPVGAIVGGLIGGIAGLIAGETASADARALSSEEEGEAKLVFGNNMNWGKVRVAESAIMSVGGYARTPFDTVYFPPGTLSLSLTDKMPFMIHELTHVWQTQHGYSVFEKLFWALHGSKAYDYGGEDGLRRATAQNKHFRDFETEQQGDICKDYYVKRKAGQDVSVYEPFIAEVKGEAQPVRGDFPVNTGPTRMT